MLRLHSLLQDGFNGPLKVLGRLLYTHIKVECPKGDKTQIHIDEFLEVASDIMSLITNVQQTNYYFDVFSQGKQNLTIEGW